MNEVTNTIRGRILKLLRQGNAMNATAIALHLNAHHDVIQEELIAMDDLNLVFMRNGFYRISAAAKKGGAE